MDLIKLDETPSTNTWLLEHWKELNPPVLVYATSQPKGRGQRGNSWESEAGKNATVSFGFVPVGVEPARQFVISEAIALGVIDLLSENGIDAKVKWPNDIYAGDKKIAGILIENAIMGSEITRCIAGIGLNVNQKEFFSDAPNPVSMTMITGKEYDLDIIIRTLGTKIMTRLSDWGDFQILDKEYKSRLWRGDGKFYPFHDLIAEEKGEARIVDIAPSGILTLEWSDGSLRSYAFKQVAFL